MTLKVNWKRVVVEAVAGFIGWTGALTPYLILVTKMDLTQYISFLIMQLTLVPPLSIVVMRFTEWLKKKCGVK